MITLTPEQIEQLRKSAETACSDRNGGETCLHMKAWKVLALAEMAQENELLTAALQAFVPASQWDNFWKLMQDGDA